MSSENIKNQKMPDMSPKRAKKANRNSLNYIEKKNMVGKDGTALKYSNSQNEYHFAAKFKENKEVQGDDDADCIIVVNTIKI